MRAPDLVAVGPPARALEAGSSSAPATASTVAILPRRDVLLINFLPGSFRVFGRHPSTRDSAGLGDLELGEERVQLAQGLSAAAVAELVQLPPRLPQRFEQAARRLWHVAVNQQRGHPEALSEPIEDRVQPLRRRIVLRQLPGPGLLHVLVEPADELPDLL